MRPAISAGAKSVGQSLGGADSLACKVSAKVCIRCAGGRLTLQAAGPILSAPLGGLERRQAKGDAFPQSQGASGPIHASRSLVGNGQVCRSLPVNAVTSQSVAMLLS